eukprot:CAMPEP_0184753638 /NCGR_PEP_ID=MMETSP0315-20130426/44208_1 /TAXON_ID=101924 /ORGANISM="Rhodosorus marinus, Strain UTEX LB 2760" /LENGTH=155 /DNA_ID=CAMNT_0027233023 /DNA_START=249 /DNA_END=715 /DNA_ORIENTATION=+
MAALAVSTLPGTKILLKAPLVKRELIFLTPDTAEVLPSYVPSMAERSDRLRPQPPGLGRHLDLGGIASIPSEENEDDIDDSLLIETLQRIEANEGGPMIGPGSKDRIVHSAHSFVLKVLDLGGIASIPSEENEDDIDDSLLIETLQRIEANEGGQ